MKNFLKTLACMVLPLAISSCSFANGLGSSGYQVVERDQAINYANQINSFSQKYGEVKAQYKTKTKYTNSDTEKTGDTCQYNASFRGNQNYWEITAAPVQDEFLYNSLDTLNSFYSFNNGINFAGQYAYSAVRYSIDTSEQKIKIEINQGTINGVANRLRLEYDSTLYLRASLSVQGIQSGQQSVSINSRFSYSGEYKEDDYTNHNYQIFTNFQDKLIIDNYTPVQFEYYIDGNYGGFVDFDEFFNKSIIISIEGNGCEYGWNGSDLHICSRQLGDVEIRIHLFDGSINSFNFETIPNYWDNEWLPVTEAISRGQPANSVLYRTIVTVSGFFEGKNMPTDFGAFYVVDNYGNQYPVNYSTRRSIESWINYDGVSYWYDAYNDFYSFASLGMQYGQEFYPDSMMIGDRLEIIYAVDSSGISFAYIVCAYLNNRFADRHINTSGSLTGAFDHAAANGESRFIYTGVRMTIKSYYGTYTDPTKYGNFVVTDEGGEVSYSLYGSTLFVNETDVLTYNSATDKFTFNNPRNFLDLEYWLGEYNGNPIYPRNLMPGDVLWMDFIIVNNRINGVITNVELCSREPHPEPEMLSLSLSEIFQRSDANATRLYATWGYITRFSTYGMYIKENINDTMEYFVYSASLEQNSLVYNPTTGLYQFTNRIRFGESHGDLRVGDYVQMITTRNDYQGQWELVGYVTGYSDAGDCYSLSSQGSSTIELYPGSTAQLYYDCLPAESRLRASFYTDNSIVSVTNDGLVTANGSTGIANV